MDVLSSVLREMRFEAAGYRRLELRAPWAVSFHQQGLRGIHIVVRGRCEILLKGRPTRVLETGDLVLAPRADAHVLRSIGNKRAPISAAEFAARSEGGRIRAGGDGDETIIVCGAFVLREADHPALAALPRIVHVPGENGRLPKWVAGYVEVITAEAFDEGRGSDIVLGRLSSALVARALRFHVDQADNPGWLKGLQDPHVAKALAAMHDDFKRDWTLVSLARAAGLSRAALAAQFRELVGEPPMRYLLGCRMRHAMALLREERATLARVAQHVGYGSEAAFAAAFKRFAGVPPGSYKRSMGR